MKTNNWITDKFIAHRGLFDNITIPENSLPAFERAVNAGYAIELDVQMTTDGVLVVFHDDTLDRMTNLTGDIREKTFDEILVECDYLIDDLPLPIGDLERWENHGLTDFEKYCVAFLYAAMQLEYHRYHICQKCGNGYFSTDEFSEFCDQCVDEYDYI